MVLIVTVVTGLTDEFHVLSSNACVRLLTTCVVATLLFLLGITCTTQVGGEGGEVLSRDACRLVCDVSLCVR